MILPESAFRLWPMLRGLAIAAMLAAPATPALALSCNSTDGGAGLRFTLGFTFGNITERDEAEFDLIRLRREGVDATAVEYWNGCIRAWVRNPDGVGEHMEFYHPDTLRRVDDFSP